MRQTSEETIAAVIRDLLIDRELFQRDFPAAREKVATLVKRHKCLMEETALIDAKVAVWTDETTSLVEDSEYWQSKMAFLTKGQENIKHESATIKMLQGLIASTTEKLIAQLGMIVSLKEKQAALRKIQDEFEREVT